MEELAISIWLLAALFLAVAFAYASVGLGGSSSYTAIMAVFGVSHALIPGIALTLNLIVSSASSFNFIRAGHLRWRLVAPFLASSIPMAYVGASLPVSQEFFHGILLVALLTIAARIYLLETVRLQLRLGPTAALALALLAGAGLGLLAGITGIGGGVYLVPLILILNLGSEHEAAACGAVFVWLNSLSGLVARLQHYPFPLADVLPLLLAVTIGGLWGSYAGAMRFTPRTMQKLLGVIIIVAIVFEARKVFVLLA